METLHQCELRTEFSTHKTLEMMQHENHQSALKEVTEFYTSDFIPDCLQSQLSLFHSSWDPKKKNLKIVISFLQSLSAVKKEYFSEK